MPSPQIANSTPASTEQTRLGKQSQTPHCVGGLRGGALPQPLSRWREAVRWYNQAVACDARWATVQVEVTVSTTPVATTTAKIASSLGLSESSLFQQALGSFLREQKRQVLQHRLDILARYGADSLADLEARIAQGMVAEHPAWEDLIVAENLTARLEELDAYLDDVQSAAHDRAG